MSTAIVTKVADEDGDKIDWTRLGLSLLTALFGIYGWIKTPNLILTIGLALFVGFIVHGILHTYFSHRAYSLGRKRQFLFGLLGILTAQAPPLVWATFHRKHHMYSDTDLDPHSPVTKSIFESFMIWAFRKKNWEWDEKLVADLAKYPELVWLTKRQFLIVSMFITGTFIASLIYYRYAIGYSTLLSFLRAQEFMAFWYFAPVLQGALSSSMVNTISHMWGTKEYETNDASTNNIYFGIISLGIAWHNNHHAHPHYINCGHKWWQTDIVYYVIWFLHKLRFVQSVRVYRP